MKKIAVTTIGPNGIDGFHIHAEGCRDISQRKYHRSEKYNEMITSMQDLVEGTYSDIIAENEDSTWEDYISEFTVYPCVGELPYEDEAEEVEAEVVEIEEVVEDEVEETTYSVSVGRKLGKNQKYVIAKLGEYGEYYKGAEWCWYFHSSTTEVLESLESRGLVESYTHRETGEKIWTLTPAGEFVYEIDIKEYVREAS